jgi:thiamine-phosphate pyrophosphorylase
MFMQYHFTPASERALACASEWTNCAGGKMLEPESLLVGLLAESECRAAVMLAKQAINISAVCQQWPKLQPVPSKPPHRNGEAISEEPTPHEGVSVRKPFSPEVERLLQAACDKLHFLPQPVELATEHLLLGLVATDHEVSAWLRQQCLNPDVIEAEIRHLYGYEEESLDAGMDDSAIRMGTNRLAAASSRREAGKNSEPKDHLLARSIIPSDVELPSATNLLRVLDAAANRAREGLRVIEDYVRFVLDDRHLTQLCKQLRHDLTAALSQISFDNRMSARETQEDVGTSLTASAELRRENLGEVVRANFARLQESLRSLEEFGKLMARGADIPVCPGEELAGGRQECLPHLLKQLRYRVYTLERAVEITRGSIERLADARLYVLLDGRTTPEEFEHLTVSLIQAGVQAIQLRDKKMGDRELLERAKLLRKLTRETPTLCIVNDRPDIAALAQANGVHVG